MGKVVKDLLLFVVWLSSFLMRTRSALHDVSISPGLKTNQFREKGEQQDELQLAAHRSCVA